MLKNQANHLQALPGSPLPVTWVDCHIPHVDTIHPLALAAARRQAGTASANTANSASTANPANPAPRRTTSEQSVCRNRMHLPDSASHLRFFSRAGSAGGLTSISSLLLPRRRRGVSWRLSQLACRQGLLRIRPRCGPLSAPRGCRCRARW